MNQGWEPVQPGGNQGWGPEERSAFARFTARWWPVMLSASVGVLLVTLAIILIPDWGGGDSGPDVDEVADEEGVSVTIPDDGRAKPREVVGTEAAVGGGRDTRLTFEHVTVFVPDESVSDEGTLRVGISEEPTPEGLGAVADAVDLSLEGTEQVDEFEMVVDLPDDYGAMSFHAWKAPGEDCCDVVDSQWDDAEGVLRSTLEQPATSYFLTAPIAGLEELAEPLVRARFGEERREGTSIECADDDGNGSQGWQVTPGGTDLAVWCLGGTGTDSRMLRLRNQTKQTLALYLPQGLEPGEDHEPFALPGLLERVEESLSDDDRQVLVLEPGGLAEVHLGSIGVGEDSALVLRPDVFTWTSDLFESTIDLLSAAYAGLPQWALPAAVPDLSSRESALSSLRVYPCMVDIGAGGSLLSGDPNDLTGIASSLSACSEEWLAERGAEGWLLPALTRVVEIPRSELTALIDEQELTDQGQGQLIGIARNGVANGSGTAGGSNGGGNTNTGCPSMSLGAWTGNWRSDSNGSGAMRAHLTSAEPTVSGTIEISGSGYEPGGRLTGSTDCEEIRFGYVGESVEFTGTIGADGATMEGTYVAIEGGRVLDRGTFTAHWSN